MPLPLALAPAAIVLLAILLFLILRWWIGRSGAAVLFTLSLLLNLAILTPVFLGIAVAQEVQEFQEKMPTTQKLVLVERGNNVLLAVAFTELKDVEKGLASFKPLSQENLQRIALTTGRARYSALTADYYKVFVVKREFLEKAASGIRPPSPGQQVPPAAQGGLVPGGLAISGDVLLKIIDSEDPAKLLAPFVPQQVIQELSGGDPARLKLLAITYILQNRFQGGLDPLFILSEYRNNDIQVYPETSVSFLLKLLPLDLPAQIAGIRPIP